MISIVNYRAGNTASVSNALERLGAEFQITDSVEKLDASAGILFPGVGHAESAMNAVRSAGLENWLKETKLPLLGICLGMQLMFDHSVEGDTQGLGLLKGKLLRFDETLAKVPHMGWNTFTECQSEHPLLKGITKDDYFYYVHSFYAPQTQDTIGSCSYGNLTFASTVAKGNKMGVQFHPEKSGKAGARLLENFVNLTKNTP